jgi:pentatricopeptide repeat protein
MPHNLRDIRSYTMIVDVYRKLGNVNELMRCLKEVKQDEIKPNAIFYCTLLKGLSSAKSIDNMKNVYHEMKEYGLDLGNNIR